jgi:hypothetical protein
MRCSDHEEDLVLPLAMAIEGLTPTEIAATDAADTVDGRGVLAPVRVPDLRTVAITQLVEVDQGTLA